MIKLLKDKKILASIVLGTLISLGQMLFIKEMTVGIVLLNYMIVFCLYLYYLLTHYIVKKTSRYHMFKHFVFVVLIALFGYAFRNSEGIFNDLIAAFQSVAFASTAMYWMIFVLYTVFISFMAIITRSKLIDSLNNFLLPLVGTIIVYQIVNFNDEGAVIFANIAILSILVFSLIDYDTTY